MIYDVAVSYAGEQKEYVQKVVAALKRKNLKVFFDRDYPELIWGKHLPETLQEIYLYNSRYILMFLSEDYVNKAYTKYEGRIAIQRILDDERIYIVKFDESHLPGINKSIAYISAKEYSVEELAELFFLATSKPNKKITISSLFTYLKTNIKKYIASLFSSTETYKVIDGNKTTEIICTENNQVVLYVRISLSLTFSKNGVIDLSVYSELPADRLNSATEHFYISENGAIVYTGGLAVNPSISNHYLTESEAMSMVKQIIKNIERTII